ncbi:interleukin-32 isoform X2 [Rousettus aegyptiacus]|uniref:Interleukin 32 n=1 Tax=Rousettus aegyptiacus TaxID=9407 RepID=A0A7J8F0F8_ROUAE|nr:interleukin-32 isoform X2 [Rousettus aegyptiacus]KAF6440772.1 interleukin 32 [Rousettus aegyptiacus]
MCSSKMKPKEVEGLRACMHETVDEYCNQLNNASEDQQIESAQLRAKESTPLLLEDQQELRRRFRRHTLEMEGPGDQQPGESLYDRVLRFFQRLLQHLQKVWQDVLTWVEEKTARLSSAVKTVWDAVKSFFSSMFSSMHQVFLSPLQV